MSSTIYEVQFPDTKVQVSGEWNQKQARDAMVKMLTDYVDSHLTLVEPEIILPEGIEANFGDAAAVTQSVEVTG